MLVWPMRMIGWLTNMLAECRASAKKIEELFAERPTVENPPHPLVPASITGALVFDDVSFEHNGSRILSNISLEAKPGSTIAIMGMTGAGKSSLINLTARYYDCTSGRILLDGIDVKKLPLRLLREQISLVLQDTFLFSDTIENNLRFGTDEASEEEIIQALQDAAIYDFIQALPEGRRTIIGERGIGLSGGQKQRLTIARALLKKSKILILDDATSNLDMETEYRIQQALRRRRGMTKFIIAHRISAVKDADEILLIHQGKVVERGTHHQLLALKRRYYEIFQAQCGDLQSQIGEDVS
jgi:ATP-binding cassette subfamily B protein